MKRILFGTRGAAFSIVGAIALLSVAAHAADTIAPTTPGSFAATPISPTKITLTWTASTDNVGVTAYLIERCSTVGCSNFAQIVSTPSSPYTNTGLTVSTSYSYRIRARDAANNKSAYSPVVTVSTPADTTPPTAPTGLTLTVASNTRINLAWTASTDNVSVTGYRVERCQGVGCTSFAQIATPTGVSYANTGLIAGSSYSYRVLATDAASNLSGYSTIATAVTTGADATLPSVPTGLTATPVSGTQINLTWTASTDNRSVAGYRVERCQGSSSCTTFAQIAAPTTTSFNDPGRTPSTIYRYRVRAIDSANLLSGYSTIVNATTPSSVVDCD